MNKTRNNFDQTSTNSNLTQENPKILNRLAQGFWTPVSDVFFDLQLKGLLTPENFTIGMMLLRYCHKNRLKPNFEMSRRELAKISGRGERQAKGALECLVRLSLLKEVFKRKGCHSKYRWNVENFADHITNLYLWETGTCTSGVHDLYPRGSGPVPEGSNTCIDYIIRILLRRIEHERDSNVENFNDDADASGIFDFAVASWSEAVINCSRAFGYGRVHLIIKNHDLSFLRDQAPRSTLWKICRDKNVVSDLQDRFQYFRSNRDFAFYVEKNQVLQVRDMVRNEFSKHFYDEAAQ